LVADARQGVPPKPMSSDRQARITSRIADLSGDGSPNDRLCRGCVEILNVDSAVVILMSEKEAGSLAATSDGHGKAESIEDLQFTLGEGPCLQAFRSGTATLEPDLLAASSRWPMFVEAAVASGVRAVFALPLQLGAIRLGVLYLNRELPGMLSHEELTDGFVLAEMATTSLLEERFGARPGEAGGLDGEGPEGAWSHRAIVHQASGMVAAQLDCSLAEALARLRSLAFSSDRTIYEVAGSVVDRRERLER
jgi:ANTAR domain-containing protein